MKSKREIAAEEYFLTVANGKESRSFTDAFLAGADHELLHGELLRAIEIRLTFITKCRATSRCPSCADSAKAALDLIHQARAARGKGAKCMKV